MSNKWCGLELFSLGSRALVGAGAALAAALLLGTTAAAQPTFSQTDPISAPPGTLVEVSADDVFDNAGTNPRFTGSASFSKEEVLESDSGIRDGLLRVQVKSAEDLNSLRVRPPEVFAVTAEVTMTNDEGETATGTITFETEYEWEGGEGPMGAPQQATMLLTASIEAPPGIPLLFKAEDLFANTGDSPIITNAVFSTTAYYSQSTLENHVLLVQAKTDEELNALPSPPDSPFTVTVEVEMRGRPYVEGTGTFTFETTYWRVEPEEEDPEAPAN